MTGMALQEFGRGGAISALLGAVAGRLAGLRPESIREAIVRELAGLGLEASLIERNERLALHCYEAVRPAGFPGEKPQTADRSGATSSAGL